MKVTAKHAFVHDAMNVNRGDEIEVSESLAGELEKRGLIQGKKAPEPQNKMAEKPSNKGRKANAGD